MLTLGRLFYVDIGPFVLCWHWAVCFMLAFGRLFYVGIGPFVLCRHWAVCFMLALGRLFYVGIGPFVLYGCMAWQGIVWWHGVAGHSVVAWRGGA